MLWRKSFCSIHSIFYWINSKIAKVSEKPVGSTCVKPTWFNSSTSLSSCSSNKLLFALPLKLTTFKCLFLTGEWIQRNLYRARRLVLFDLLSMQSAFVLFARMLNASFAATLRAGRVVGAEVNQERTSGCTLWMNGWLRNYSALSCCLRLLRKVRERCILGRLLKNGAVEPHEAQFIETRVRNKGVLNSG